MKIRQTILAAIAMVSTICFQPATIRAATTVSPANSFAYGANVGWLNWAGDTNNGAVVGGYVCSGYIYSANVGWINLGSGAPTNGAAYQNLSANDFGVNMDSAGNLRGYAYAANVGWINFEATGAPTLNLTTGALSGYAWGANIGWISLSNAYANVQTTLPVTPPSGMVAWWPANGNAVDVVGGNKGTLTNGAAYVPGEVAQAFNFNANSAGVFIGNPPALQLQNFTIEAWVKRSTTSKVSNDPSANGGAAALFYFGSQGYGMGMHTDGAISLTKIDVDDVNDDGAGARVTDLNWHHVAVTKSGTVVSFYVDGVAYPSVSYGSTFQFTTPAAIGVRGDNINANNNDSFAGAIDELAIYNRALSASEVQSIYQAGAAGKSQGFPGTNYVWINAGGGSWINFANWLAGMPAQGLGNAADFSTLTLGADAYVTLDGARTIGSLVFGDQGNAHKWFLNTGSGDPLTFGNSPGGITVHNQTATLGLYLAGVQGLTKNGNGNLELVPPAGYTGGTTNNAGTLQLDGNFNTISNSPLVINAGVVASRATLFLNVSQNPACGSTNVMGAGTLRLIATTNGPANPDLNFGQDASGVIYYGAQMDMATLDLGASQRYIYATSGHNSVARWRNWEDARINGNIIGGGGITYIAQNNNAGANNNQPMECPLVLAGSNTFAGELEIQRGSVYLLNPNALTQTNQLLMDPIAGHNTKFFLYGNNTTVANLTSSGAGNTLIANGNVLNNTAPIPAGTLTVEETSSTVFSGQLVDTNYDYDAYAAPEYTSGALALTKIGPAILTLAGVNTYTGPTTIIAGTLAVNGSLTSPVTVSAGATLAGTGSFTNLVTVNGTNAPGNGSVGTLTTGPETWNPSGCLVFTMTNASTVGGSSLLNINGVLNVAATPASPFVIHLVLLTAAQIPGPAGGFNSAINQSWPLATTAGFTGFAAASFVVDTSGFANTFNGVFNVSTSGNTLQLNYVAAVTPPPGMVAWWPANGNAVDVVGGDNGTLTNGVSYVSGEVAQAFNFNANSAMILLTNSPALHLQNFTVETWVKRGSLTAVSSDPNAVAGNALMFGYGDSGYSFAMGPNGNLILTWVDHDDVVSSAAVTDTAWHHIVVTTTNGSVVFYLDGTAYPAASYPRTYTFATAPAIGGRADNLNQNNNDSFLGSIDELAVYSNALSAAQILSIYQAGAAGKNVGYYLNPPPSSVGITRSGSSLTIAWPNTGSYIVQQNTNLAVAAGWVTVTNAVATSNGTNSITLVPPLSGNLFFRLKH